MYLYGMIAFKHRPTALSPRETLEYSSLQHSLLLAPKSFQEWREVRDHRELFWKLMIHKPESSGLWGFWSLSWSTLQFCSQQCQIKDWVESSFSPWTPSVARARILTQLLLLNCEPQPQVGLKIDVYWECMNSPFYWLHISISVLADFCREVTGEKGRIPSTFCNLLDISFLTVEITLLVQLVWLCVN